PGTRVNRLISGAHLLDVEDLTSAFKLFAHHHPPAGRISCDHLWIVHTPLPFVAARGGAYWVSTKVNLEGAAEVQDLDPVGDGVVDEHVLIKDGHICGRC